MEDVELTSIYTGTPNACSPSAACLFTGRSITLFTANDPYSQRLWPE